MSRIPPQLRLDTRDLRVVLAVAAAGTTAEAADLLHLSQPAVSRALVAAEERIGVRLFERSARGLVPTAAGERLVTGAGRLLAELGELEHVVRAPITPPARLRLVCECYTAYHWLPSTLQSLRAGLPSLEIALAIEHTAAPAAALEAGTIDVALLTTAEVSSAALAQAPLFSDEIVFVVAATHPLAARKTLTRADLQAHPLLTSTVPKRESSWFHRAVFGRTRPTLHYRLLPLTEAILDVARAGLGIAVLSEWIARPHLDRGDLVARRLASGPLRRPWRIAYRKEVADAAMRLRAALQSTVPSARRAA